MATDTVTPTDGPTGASTSSASGYVQPEVDVPALTRLLDGRYAEVRNLVRSNLSAYSSILTDAETLSRADYRERVKELVVEMASTGQTGMGFPEEYGGGGDIGASIAAFETLSFGDLSVLVKVGVQFGLFGGAILQLGTERHHEAYLRRIVTGELMGCFAMTETGHGSNVQALGTVATYDVATQEFVITTTREDARKDYIGNAAEHGELAVVFAQLEVGGEGRGVHAFVVPIRVRDDSGELVPAPGVTIADDGLKMGLNGVDNGRLWFDEVRVPRDNLLNRFADVTPAGVYESPIDNPNRRFFTMLGTLIQGRVCVGGAGINAAKVALTIAVKYALRRRQFEASGEQEELLLDYGMHQRPTSSPPSRATTTSCCSWSPRACSPTTPATSRTWTSSGWSASWPAWPSTPWWRRPASTACWSGCATCCPAATSGTRRPACSTRSTSWRCTASARST